MKHAFRIFILLVLSYSCLQSQDLQKFTAKAGLDFATKQAKIALGDSAKLIFIETYFIYSSPYNLNTYGSFESLGLFYTYKDSSVYLTLVKKNDVFEILKSHKSGPYNDADPLDSFDIDSDLAMYRADNCYNNPEVHGCYVEYYHLSKNEFGWDIMFKNKPTWYIDSYTIDYTEKYYWIDAINGECKNTYDDIKEKINLERDEISIYPNPTDDIIQIKLSDDSYLLNLPVKIYNCYGECVLTSNITSTNIRLSLKGFAAGMYFINVGNLSYKILKI